MSERKPGFFFRLYKEFSILSTTIKTIRRNFKREKLEPEAYRLPVFLKPGDICLDIGGAYARYAKAMAEVVGPAGHVYSFEPGDYSYRVFKTIKSFHGLKNISVFKMALSDKAGEMKLASPLKEGRKYGASLAYLSAGDQNGCVMEVVQVSTVDEMVETLKLPKVDFIKCDVEGAELSAFRGAVKTIGRFHPLVLSEVDGHHLERFGLTPNQMFDFWKGFGYVSLRLAGERFVKAQSFQGDSNYLFVPEDKLSVFHL